MIYRKSRFTMWKRLDKVITINQQKYDIRALQSMCFFHWHLKVSDSDQDGKQAKKTFCGMCSIQSPRPLIVIASDSDQDANLCNATHVIILLISGNYFVHLCTNNLQTVRFIDFLQTRMTYRDVQQLVREILASSQ